VLPERRANGNVLAKLVRARPPGIDEASFFAGEPCVTIGTYEPCGADGGSVCTCEGLDGWVAGHNEPHARDCFSSPPSAVASFTLPAAGDIVVPVVFEATVDAGADVTTE
jgi:hypothetical protein